MQTSMTVAMEVFQKQFGDRRVRLTVLCVDGEPWFPGGETATALGYSQGSLAIRTHVDREDKRNLGDLRSGDDIQLTKNEASTIYISESGFYSLVMRSRMSIAVDFQKWVSGEVLPSIRLTGRYDAQSPAPNSDTLETYSKEIDDRRLSLSIRRVNDNLWFPGSETAIAFGFINPRKALRDHVGDTERRTLGELIAGRRPLSPSEAATVYITESGLYSLILRSRLPQAVAFQRWVTGDVLPAIRRTGRYVAGEVEKRCYKCECSLPPSQFHRNASKPDGLDNRCKTCKSEEPHRHREPEEAPEEPARKRARPEDMWLYVFSYDFDPWGLQFGYKIGRSSDVEARRLDLGGSHAFTVIEHARFRCSGHLENTLHRRFAEHRVEGGTGCEWYHVSLAEILHAIAELHEK